MWIEAKVFGLAQHHITHKTKEEEEEITSLTRCSVHHLAHEHITFVWLISVTDPEMENIGQIQYQNIITDLLSNP